MDTLKKRAYVIVAVFAIIALIALPSSAKAALFKISTADEIKIGKDFYESYQKEHKYLDNTPEGARVKQVGKKLAQRVTSPDWDYTFTLVDDKDVNAFAVPGGYVFINKGLYDYISYDEAMLAAVLGHEAGHVVERHYKKMYEKAVKGQLGVSLLGVLIGGDTGQAVADALGYGGSLVLLKYSRDDEESADRIGIELAYGAGFDPYGMTRNMRLFSELESKLGETELFDLWRTHPQPKERVERCQRIALELSGKDEAAYHPPSPPAGNIGLLAPTGVVATDGAYTDRIHVTWNASSGATNYKVYRAASQSGDYTNIGQSGSTSYDDYDSGASTYWYKVKASNSYGDSEYSSADSGYRGNGSQQPSPATQPPSPPANVAASDGAYEDMIRITWTASSGAGYYKVYRATSQGGNYTYIGQISSTTYDDNVSSSNGFWYKVRAINTYGGSGYSNADSGYRGRGSQQPSPPATPPSPPANVAASDGTYADMVRIAWTASSGATSYKLYRATSQSGNYTYIGQISSAFYEDYVNDTSAYWYRVRAINTYGGSGYSNADSGYRGSGSQLPNPPANVAASDGAYTDLVRVTWTASSGASGYNVYRATSQNGNYIYIGQSSSSPYDDYDSDTNTYWYKVKASNSYGDSEYSSADSGYKGNGSQPPSPPANLAASDGTYTDMVRIAWTASSGATSYKVYRATSPSGNYSYIGQTSSTFYEDYVNDSIAYWYKVRAINTYGGSGYSNADRGYKR